MIQHDFTILNTKILLSTKYLSQSSYLWRNLFLVRPHETFPFKDFAARKSMLMIRSVALSRSDQPMPRREKLFGGNRAESKTLSSRIFATDFWSTQSNLLPLSVSWIKNFETELFFSNNSRVIHCSIARINFQHRFKKRKRQILAGLWACQLASEYQLRDLSRL